MTRTEVVRLRPSLRVKKWNEHRLPLLFVLPAVLVLLFLFAYPLLNGIRLAFTDSQTLAGDGDWVGFDNFAYLFSTGLFWDALFKGLVWTAGSVFVEVLLGVLAALTLNKPLYGQKLLRGLVLLPYLAPVVVTAMLWRWMFDIEQGLINKFALATGLADEPVRWLSQMPMAMISVILVGGWAFFPFTATAVLGRLQSIPTYLYDVAEIEGAGRFSKFWDVTRPAIYQVLMTILMFRVLWAFNDFGTIYLLTGGGPGGETRTLPLTMYELGFRQFDIGMAAAVAVLMMVILAVFMILYSRLLTGRNTRR